MTSERYLLDTTIWVRYFTGEASIEESVRALILQDKVLACGIIILEVLREARTADEYNRLYRDFKALPMLSLDTFVWEESYKLGFRLRKAGVVVPLADILISAMAIRHGCPLMHLDKHFTLIGQHSKLKEYQV